MGKLLSDRERIELKRLRKQYRRTNSEGYSRVCVILAVDMGFSYDTIHDLFRVSASTVSKYKEQYEKGGLKLLLANHYKAYGRLTEEELKRLDKMLEDQLYMKARDVVQLIEREFGMHYSESQVVRILKKLGYVYKKTKGVPAKADAAAQAKCRKVIEEQLEKSAENNEVVLF